MTPRTNEDNAGNDEEGSKPDNAQGFLRRSSSALFSRNNSDSTSTGILRRASSIFLGNRRRGSSILSSFFSFGEEISLDIVPCPTFLDEDLQGLEPIFGKYLDNLSDDAVTKICRQLEFWYVQGVRTGVLSQDEFVKLCERLCLQSSWYLPTGSIISVKPLVPKVRFGKTNIKMPIVTCGGMRFQHTWLPDMIPLLSESKSSVLSNSPSQDNVKNIVRTCLQLGVNHFETARLYGTSEYQLIEALYDLMIAGEIKREDFILQTKITPQAFAKDFQKTWNQSWEHIGAKFQYIDLFSIHGLSTQEWETTFIEASKLKEEGKIRHIGFSTHGTSEQIMKLINTKKFEYINIHYHFFGSYHGEGTSDTLGGQGNLACVQRALELDMGVFNISPFDKGGKLYRPSRDLLLSLGPELTPIAFSSLHAWKTAGMHTLSVGVARPSDLDEVLEAARLWRTNDVEEKLLTPAENRLRDRVTEKCGKEWADYGLLNVPTCYEECTHGIAIGHILWLHKLLVSHGMYDFCKDRYTMLEANNSKWNSKKRFDENVKKWMPFNAGRGFDSNVDLTLALSKHRNPELALEKLKECHSWLNSSNGTLTDEQLEDKGWGRGYNLTVWEEFAGESITAGKVLLQAVTRGRAGITGTGPSAKSAEEAASLRSYCKNLATPVL
mmetsp:Transcript_5968/g.8764  ORF Transcript_5968/g.8764 Transcript_5968/m.8764 type:complete len:665 (+) Transcript_5968:23-2017(+)